MASSTSKLKTEELVGGSLSQSQDPDQGAEIDLEGNEIVGAGQEHEHHQENLLTKVVSFDQKSYYLDVRENSRGKYLKFTESSQRRRSTILLSGYVIRTLLSVLEDAIKEQYDSNIKYEDLDTHWVTIFSKKVISGQKKIYIDLMQNKRGRSLNIAEVSPVRAKTSVVVSERGWFNLRRALEEIQQEFPEFAGNGKTGTSSSPRPRQNHEEGVEGGSNTKVLDSKKMAFAAKRFFFDFLENDLGRYCKISEVRRGKRESVYVPRVCFDIFIKLLDLFIAEDYQTTVAGTEVAQVPDSDTENHTTITRRVMSVESDDADAAARKYHLDLRQNDYGKFLRVTELRPSRSNCVFFPSDNFAEVRDTFKEFNDMA